MGDTYGYRVAVRSLGCFRFRPALNNDRVGQLSRGVDRTSRLLSHGIGTFKEDRHRRPRVYRAAPLASIKPAQADPLKSSKHVIPRSTSGKTPFYIEVPRTPSDDASHFPCITYDSALAELMRPACDSV